MGDKPLQILFRSTLANGDIAEYAVDDKERAFILINGKPIKVSSDALVEYQRLTHRPPPSGPKP